MEVLLDLTRGKELYEFALSHQELNFNDLYERLEDDTLLSTTTISDMNTVSLFCVKLHEDLEKEQEISPIPDPSGIVLRLIKKEIESESRFLLKLKNCIDSIHALKVISTSSLNKSENTINILRQVMKNGTISI
jgi:hypothetical protein